MPDNDTHAPEVDEFRENFYHEEWARLMSQKIDNSNTHIGNLERLCQTTFQTITDENRNVKKKLEDNWKYPKIAFGLVVGLGTLILGFGFMREWMVIADLQTRISDMREALKENDAELQRVQQSRAYIESLQAKAKEALNNFDARADAKLDEAISEYSQALSAAKSSLNAGFDISAAAHRSMTLVGLAQEHLANEQNPQQALEYSRLGLAELTNAAENLEQLKVSDNQNYERLLEVLGMIRPMVLTIKCRAHLQMDEFENVSSAAETLIAEGSDYREGHYYHGVANLHLCASSNDVNQRNTYRKLAIDSLNSATEDNSHRAQASLLLALAYFDKQNFKLAKKKAATYSNIQNHVGSERDLLNPNIRANLLLAEGIEKLSRFALKELDEFEGFDCAIVPGSITQNEAQMFEGIFANAIRNRETVFPSSSTMRLASEADKLAEDWGKYSLKLIFALRSSCGAFDKAGGDGCAGCGSSVIGSTIITPEQRKTAEQFGLTLDLPLRSRNAKLGQPENANQLVMTIVRIVPAKQSRIVTKFRLEESEGGTKRVPFQETETFSVAVFPIETRLVNASEIPLDYYVQATPALVETVESTSGNSSETPPDPSTETNPPSPDDT